MLFHFVGDFLNTFVRIFDIVNQGHFHWQRSKLIFKSDVSFGFIEAPSKIGRQHNLNISFNSKYLIDIASEIEDKNLKMNFKDSVSPVLIEDLSDKNSYYVIMPMKI